jgi:cyclic beta-1,2-glucan synthetase
MAFALAGTMTARGSSSSSSTRSATAAPAAGIAVYKVEPYVIAADVYALPPHTGRGGWTWYTGSAGWMYRTLVETLLGVNLQGESLMPDAAPSPALDDRQGALPLPADGLPHHLRRWLGGLGSSAREA